MALYTVRVTNEEGKITAWIDQAGKVCIQQPSAPGTQEGSTWASEAEAQAWADEHASQLEKMNDDSIANKAQQDELIAQAKIDSQKIADIYEMLTALSNK
jgi:hypothetical protein